jgi:hypothetical protein
MLAGWKAGVKEKGHSFSVELRPGEMLHASMAEASSG